MWGPLSAQVSFCAVGGFDKPTSSSSILANVVNWHNKDKVNFPLSGKELGKAREFINQQRQDDKSEGCIAGRFSYIFTPTSIGLGVSNTLQQHI